MSISNSLAFSFFALSFLIGVNASSGQSATAHSPFQGPFVESPPFTSDQVSEEELLGTNETPITPPDYTEPIQNPGDMFNPVIPTEEARNRLNDIPISLGTIWIAGDQTELVTVDTSVKFPLLFGFGSPPPIVKTGFVYTNLETRADFGLPNKLNEYTIGVSKVYRLTDRWTIRSMLGIALATDDQNFSSDAWQFRGGIFGIYQYNENWQWTIGAIALGRDDLPVVPALGAVWTPNSRTRWDLIPPNPRLNFLLHETGTRENWIYTGFGFNGKTWGYRKDSGANDRLTYQDLRVVTGWQSRPKGEPGAPYVRGRKYNLELGYTFSRYLEFDQELIRQSLDDAWMIQLSTRY